jgi:hypothetical protein
VQSTKNRWRIWALLFLLLVLAITAATIYGNLISQKQDVLKPEMSLTSLENVRNKYAEINSVHLVADAKIVIFGARFAVGVGSFEYWAQGNEYRYKCRTDKSLKLATDLDVAYNGERFQFLDLRSGTLSYRLSDDVRSTAALPNPLFLPVEYLSKEDDDCSLCRLRLTDMKANNERWNTRSQGLREKRQYDGTGVVTDLEMPGGVVQKRPFKIRLKMKGDGEEDLWPAQIEKVDPEGHILESIVFSNPMDKRFLPLPRDILITTFDDKGNLALRLEYSVRVLEINHLLDKEVFRISFDEAETVWDSDGRRFVKEKKSNASRQ